MERMDFEPVRRTMACWRFLPPYMEGDWESGRHVFTYDWGGWHCHFRDWKCTDLLHSKRRVLWTGGSRSSGYKFRPVSADTMEIYSFWKKRAIPETITIRKNGRVHLPPFFGKIPIL